MAEKNQLEVGQRVRFRRLHDKHTQLTGVITAVHEDDDFVEITTEPDGKVIEVETKETAHATDVFPAVEEASQASTAEESGTEEHPRIFGRRGKRA